MTPSPQTLSTSTNKGQPRLIDETGMGPHQTPSLMIDLLPKSLSTPLKDNRGEKRKIGLVEGRDPSSAIRVETVTSSSSTDKGIDVSWEKDGIVSF